MSEQAGRHDVHEPVFVGRPPSDAYVGLVRLDSGEIRHYDYGAQRDGEKRCYIASFDGGLTWQTNPLPEGHLGADRRSPLSGEYIRLSGRRGEGIVAIRSEGGIDARWTTTKVFDQPMGMLKPAVFIRGGRRILVGCQRHVLDTSMQLLTEYPPDTGAGTLHSDDDGITWRRSNLIETPHHRPGGVHMGTRWNHGACEPSVVELHDGRVWMLIRTSQDRLYESFSEDGGATWSPASPSRFYATCTMPTVGRLDDGRLLVTWCNTTPLPELPRADGYWEDVFTNRDAVHAAISDDEGQTWRGFRELMLDGRRNESDYAETGGIDRGVHQTQFVDLGDGNVLVSFGQHWMHRSMVVFHTDWLNETHRSDDFSDGLGGWSVHQYIEGVRGHCSYNRKAGARLVDHPDRKGRKVLHIRRPRDPVLLCENEGATWNFPAGRAGNFTTHIMLREGHKGACISLLDRWFNPTDLFAQEFAVFRLRIPPDGLINDQTRFEPGKWYELCFEWDGLEKLGFFTCRLSVNGTPQNRPLPLNRKSPNGISYVQFISTAEATDETGFFVESVRAETSV